MADIIQLNQEEIKSQLGDMVRKSVEDTLNTMLDAEADQIPRLTSMNALTPGRTQELVTTPESL